MPIDVVTVDRLDPHQRHAVAALDREIAGPGGEPRLDHDAWLEIEGGATTVPAHALATGPGGDLVGYAHVADPGGPDLRLRLLVRPADTDRAAQVVGPLARIAAGRPVTWFVRGATPDDDAVADRLGLVNSRQLWQMRRSLPVEEPWSLAWRPFRPGFDEAAWIEVNNRAFAAHPDQGRQRIADLEAREREPWFDPDGFLLHEDDGRLLGFCWTKIHRETEPPIGEIYVIGVDPDAHGRGLGRALVLAGLDWLHRAGLRTAMLYVESDNQPALALYDRLGFTRVQRDVFYQGSLPER